MSTLSSLSAALLASSALYFTAPNAAYAQDVFDEVITTATKIEKNASELGLSLTVIDGEILSQFDSAEELTQRVAGLQAAVANGNQIAFQIRGIGAVDHQALTPTAAAVYIDGVFQATNVQTGPLLFDLERAEVLKGPQGSLYGRNATAGAINFISKRPSMESEGYIAAEIGNFERVNLNAASNIPVSDDFALRLSGRYLTQGPQIENVQTVDGIAAPDAAGGERNEFGLRALGLITPSDKTEILINVHYSEDNGVNASPRNEGLGLDDHQISVGPDGVQDTDNEFYGVSAQVAHEFDNGVKLVSLSAYEGYNQQYGFDFAALQDFSALIPSFSGSANLSYDRDFTQVSQELRLSKSSERYESMVGLYLEAETFKQEYRVWCGRLDLTTLVGSCNYIAAGRRVGATSSPAGASASTLQSLIEQDRSSAALFTHNTYHVTPNLDIVFGARLTSEAISGRGQGRHIFDNGAVGFNNAFETDSDGNSVAVGPAIGSNEIDETQFSGTLGVNYALSDNALFYASYANGYKSGGFNGEVINNASHFDDAGLFGAETVDTFELGAKISGARYSLSGAAFYNDYNDPQARFFENVTLASGQIISLNSLSNFDEATSYGLEVEGRAQPLDDVNVFGGITLQSSEIDDPSQATLDGAPLPFASETSAVLGADYTLAVSDAMDLILAANGKYQSEFTMGANLGAQTDFVQEGYSVIDASATLAFDNGTQLGLWGRNLGNEDYAVAAYRFFGDTTFRGAPRSYGVALKYSY